MTKPTQTQFPATDTPTEDRHLGALLTQYPQLNVPQVSRRALLAMGSLMALNLTACGSSDDTGVGSSGSGGGSGGGNVTGSVVATFAGSGSAGSANSTGTAASFNGPVGVAVDSSGNVYVADSYNNLIRKITSAGAVSTFAGSSQGFVDGTGTAAKFYQPYGVAVDSSGNVYVGDTYNNSIRMITSAGVVSTLAGGTWGTSAIDGTGTAAKFNYPYGVAVDSSGNVYVADHGNNKIRQIVVLTQAVTTLAGSTQGFADGTGSAAQFFNPFSVAVDSSGNVYVADFSNRRIRQIVVSTQAVTTLAGSSTASFADGTGSTAKFNGPYGVAVDSSGNVYVADSGNNRIRKIVASTGVVSTVAGSTAGSANGIGTAAQFSSPDGVAVDSSGNIYVADTGNNLIRKIS